MSPYLVKPQHGSSISLAINYFRPALPLGSEQSHVVEIPGLHERRFPLVTISHFWDTESLLTMSSGLVLKSQQFSCISLLDAGIAEWATTHKQKQKFSTWIMRKQFISILQWKKKEPASWWPKPQDKTNTLTTLCQLLVLLIWPVLHPRVYA